MTHRTAALAHPRTVGLRLLAAWLLLMAIVGHAVLPVGSPFQRSTGSAFSITTVEVVTVPKRKQQDVAAQEARAPDGSAQRESGDASLLPATPQPVLVMAAAFDAAPSWAGTGPPPLLALAHRPQQPRAPPVS